MKSAIIFLFIWSTTLLASELRELPFSKNEKSKVSFKLGEKWQHEKKVLGLDHLYVYPHGKTRDLISLVFSPPGKVNFTMSRKKEQQKFLAQKLKWLSERQAKLVEFFELKTNVSGKHISYRFGLKYIVSGRNIIEYSQYHFCDGRLVYLKLLGDSSSDIVTTAEKQIAESFKCVGF